MRVYDTKELAEQLRTSEKKVRLFRQTDLLRSRKIGRTFLYTDDDLNEFLRLTAGADLSNEEQIRILSQSIKKDRVAALPK